ncbi:DNA topoisomerase [Phocaeicola sp.]|uniref:type IA DNA topoisomerase n=1 Tax=Phocaeicola sp. TaxID=2773926 RepID=UPI00307C2D26
MKAIIAEKPSVGMDIARVVGATEKKDGYFTGNGYMITWALGHLVSLALPGTYGYTKTVAEDLPMIPEPFRLVARQVKTAKGMATDIAAGKQLKIIDEVFSKCDSIIVATDAGREGELIFRWIYSYLGYTKPFQRLWISSLTDEAIREGMANLKKGSEYDSLYAAADSRAKADWLVGMNASRALAIASGSANSSIGRVQTPTLAMICARFKENRNFVSTPFWQLHITLKQGDAHRQFVHTVDFKKKDEAETAYRSITSDSVATINKVERRRTFQQAPLLYDLTALQKDCNIHYDLPADKTLSIAQSLYEKKLISYPRTGSRYISEDVMAHIPALLEKVTEMPEFREYGLSFDCSNLNTRSVDATKVTDHHALIITGIAPEELSEAESVVYTLIAGRMLEAFSPPCEKERLLMECVCEELDFRSQSAVIVTPGWRGVFARSEDREKDEPEGNGGTAVFAEREEIPVMGHGLAQKKTLPKPLYTDATLLGAMENCGKEVSDEQAREALKDSGIGTPATRAAIITTLFKRDYIERSGKSIRPTEKGLYLYESVKEMMVADVELTGTWEKALTQIEGHTLDTDAFLLSIKGYAGKVTEEILRLKFPEQSAHAFACPKCRTGNVVIKSKVAKCDNEGCGLLLFRKFLNKELTDQHLEQLLSSGSTKLIKGFKGKKSVSFDAAVAFDEGFNLKLSFPKPKSGKGK